MKAFISYSHHDAEFLTSLHQHLAALRRQNLIETWTDREIDAGSVLNHEISAAMDDAGLFLLLVSSSFLSSDYCYEKEFRRALEKQAEGKAIIVPILVRPCDSQIPELTQFKALPEDARPVRSPHWHSEDEAFANVAAGLRSLLDKRSKKKAKFVPDESNVTAEQRAELNRVHHEIVERLTAKKSHLDDATVRREFGKWAGIVWGQFHETFGTKENGLPSLAADKFEEARQWLIQYRASKDSNLKRAKPQQYKNTLTKTIYSVGGGLGWSKGEIYSFAQNIVGYSTPIESLNDLGNSQLEKVRDKIRYELSKRRTKSAQSKAKKTPAFHHPTDDLANEILHLILGHAVAEERGLTEILRESPTGPLFRLFIPNTTARGQACSVKKAQFAPAMAELIRLGWLLQPESNEAIRIGTQNSMRSRWCPWEIGYADGVKPIDNILIIATTDNAGTHGAEYLQLYRHIDPAQSGGFGAFHPNQQGIKVAALTPK